MKKCLSFVLALSLLAGVFLGTTPASAATAAFRSDTTGNFNLMQGKTYTFKLTPSDPKSVISFSSGNSKELQVVSNVKKGNAYYATIKAVGKVGSETGVYAAIKGQKMVRQCVVKITASAAAPKPSSTPLPDPHQWDNFVSSDDNYMSIINGPDYGTAPSHEATSSSVRVNGISSALPEEISIEKGMTVRFEFETMYDMTNFDPVANHGVNPDRVQPPDVTFTNPDAISYDHGTMVGDMGVGYTPGDAKYGATLRTVNITAVGDVGDTTDVYSEVFGIRELQCTITVGPEGSGVQGDGIETETPQPQPRITGLYGITEVGKDDEGYVWEHTGVLVPLVRRYDPSKNYNEQALALNGNLMGIDLYDDTITNANRWDAVAGFVQKDGKFGLSLNWWRQSRDDNTPATELNGVLTAFCFLSNDKLAGEALWAWLDARNTAQGVKVTDYGFTDSNPTGMTGTLTYKDGTSVDYNEESNGHVTLYFNPKP